MTHIVSCPSSVKSLFRIVYVSGSSVPVFGIPTDTPSYLLLPLSSGPPLYSLHQTFPVLCGECEGLWGRCDISTLTSPATSKH